MNMSIANILFDFLTSEKIGRTSYKFSVVMPNLKFVDLIKDGFNCVIDNGINYDRIMKNIIV